jgi:hypothetical protein
MPKYRYMIVEAETGQAIGDVRIEGDLYATDSLHEAAIRQVEFLNSIRYGGIRGLLSAEDALHAYGNSMSNGYSRYYLACEEIKHG